MNRVFVVSSTHQPLMPCRPARALANRYALVETAQANGWDPWRYLKGIFTALPAATTGDHLEALGLIERITEAIAQFRRLREALNGLLFWLAFEFWL